MPRGTRRGYYSAYDTMNDSYTSSSVDFDMWWHGSWRNKNMKQARREDDKSCRAHKDNLVLRDFKAFLELEDKVAKDKKLAAKQAKIAIREAREEQARYWNHVERQRSINNLRRYRINMV